MKRNNNGSCRGPYFDRTLCVGYKSTAIDFDVLCAVRRAYSLAVTISITAGLSIDTHVATVTSAMHVHYGMFADVDVLHGK